MASAILILQRDQVTGKQNVIVKVESDQDSLPIEHENLHKSVVEKLLEKGLSAEDLGNIIITREKDGNIVVDKEDVKQDNKQKSHH